MKDEVKTMNGLKEHKFMDLLTTYGYVIAALIIIYSIATNHMIYVVAGVIIIFIMRLIGYSIDRFKEMKDEK